MYFAVAIAMHCAMGVGWHIPGGGGFDVRPYGVEGPPGGGPPWGGGLSSVCSNTTLRLFKGSEVTKKLPN